MLWDKNNYLIKFDRILKNRLILFGQFSWLSFLAICFNSLPITHLDVGAQGGLDCISLRFERADFRHPFLLILIKKVFHKNYFPRS